MGERITTPKFRASFPNVFMPKAFAEGQDAKYSIVMLFDKGVDISELKKIAKAAAVEKWGDKIPKNLRTPFRDGDTEKEGIDGYENTIFISASSKMQPGIVDHKTNPILDQGEFYGGCYARATLTAFAYDVAGNKGVSFGLQNVQKLNDGEPFSGRMKAEDDFSPIETEESTAEDTEGDLF